MPGALAAVGRQLGWSLGVLDPVRHAGGVFLGELNAEAIGDYTAGPSHIMPTGGTARFSSPVNVSDFVKIISVIGLNERGLRAVGPAAIRIEELH